MTRSSITGLFAMLVFAVPAVRAQTPQADIARTMDGIADKYVALAAAFADEQYAYRPGDGVRSVSEVLMHVAGANYVIPNMIGCSVAEGSDAPAGFGEMATFEAITDRGTIARHVAESFAHLESCAADLSDEALGQWMEWFGTYSGSGQTFMYFLAGHAQEHLGQLIAYARVNGVVPPWSMSE